MSPAFNHRLLSLLPFALTFALGLTTILSRPALPIDETRYLTVAWEMHHSGNYLVPHLNGETYAHKPPLLFWLINLVWSVTGVQDWSARLVGPLMALLSVWLTSRIARKLFPAQPLVSEMAPLIHASFMLWMLFSPTTMFDATQTVFIQLTLLGFWRIQQDQRWWDFLACGVPLGLAILAKGPVVFVHTLPVALAAYFWAGGQPLKRFSGRVALSVATAAVVALAWALPAAYFGGEAYGNELLWGQTAGRMVKSFAHQQPFWFYLPLLPICLLPWAFYGGFWRVLAASVRGTKRAAEMPVDRPAIIDQASADTTPQGLRFAMCAALGSLICLSLVSGKQAYYLIPAMPMTAICLAWIISRCTEQVTRAQTWFMGIGTVLVGFTPIVLSHLSHENIQRLGQAFSLWAIAGFMICGIVLVFRKQQSLLASVRVQATCSVTVICFLLSGLSNGLWKQFDMRPLGVAMKQLTDQQVPVAWFGDYHGQLGFAGRMQTPLAELLNREELEQWLVKHPDGRVIVRSDKKAHPSEQAVAAYPGSYIESQFLVQRGLNVATMSVVTRSSDRIAEGPKTTVSN